MDFKKLLLILLALFMLGCVVFAACNDTPPSQSEETSATDEQTTQAEQTTQSEQQTQLDTEESTTEEPEEETTEEIISEDESKAEVFSTEEVSINEPETEEVTTEEMTTEEVTTEEATTEEQTTTNEFNDPISPTSITFTGNESFNWRKMLTNANQCTYEIVKDDQCKYVLKLTTKNGANDPFIILDYKNYLKKFGMRPASADEYKFIVLKIKAENVTSDSFELFYAAGSIAGPVGGYSMVSVFDQTNPDWQYVIFDLSKADWSGNINMFRFDFLTTPSGGGETVYIASIDMYKTADEVYGNFDIDMTRPGEGSDLKENAVDGVNYDKLMAENEDESVLLWFDHMTEKTYRDQVASSGMNTYVIHMAGNSIENCQIFVSPTLSDRNVRIEITDMVDGQGNILKTQLLREHYVKIGNDWVPDALPPVQGSVSVAQNTSQGFVLKVWADSGQPAGLYNATVNIYDADTGECIKTANVYTKVYDFSLSEHTALKTAVQLSPWVIANSYTQKGMNDKSQEELYKIYYDFMLENRISCYALPYSLWDERVIEYLDNPRVTSFSIKENNGGDESGAHAMLSQKQEWLDKGYFYYVDEPTNADLLYALKSNGDRLANTYPGYRQVSPFFTNITIEGEDQITFMEPYTQIWCTKVFAFTPREKSIISGTQYLMTKLQEQKYGTFAQRMAKQVADGDELWLYFCWEPNQPYANWLATGDGTEPLVSIWQCKLTEATGVLYWGSAYWSSDPYNDLTSTVVPSVYGDGVLIYSGAEVGVYEAVSSFRLENIRLGIQDYQMLYMLEQSAGKEAAQSMIEMVTTDVITYTNDDDYLHAVRIILAEKTEMTQK